jgi:hypothetical protein
MKNVIIFIIIFGLGALTYGLLIQLFSPKMPGAEEDIDRAPTTTLQTTLDEADAIPEQEEKEPERPVVITPDGSLLDGPFVIFDKDGKETGGTVQIIRSPEETLLQFEDWKGSYSGASHVYFSNDLNANEYYNLGPAKMTEDYLIYGIPLDAKLDSYSYILIYDTQLDETKYYSKIR